jgi:hypothetical protein
MAHSFRISTRSSWNYVIRTLDRQSDPFDLISEYQTIFQESPRWLASVGKQQEALQNLAYLRREHESSAGVLYELAEIEAAIEEERIARESLGWKEEFFGKGNFVRFVIAFVQ